MINWTKDERTAALMEQAVKHYLTTDELSLEHEAQMELIREEYLNDLWGSYRGECFGEFDDWHNQPTVEEFVDATLPVQELVQ